ncbi:plasmid stabilization protein [Immundisolibacter sp.]|uniref:FitA-like ribbon-helix-helix domain-containing protein n=1 Tax=Immundisolibacter sp. TaxID=1934948 RepID=UPI003569DF33
MSSITIRNLGDTVKHNLRVRAALHGRSMEDEARTILRNAVEQDAPSGAALVQRIRARFAALGDVDLLQPPREAMREPPELPTGHAPDSA